MAESFRLLLANLWRTALSMGLFVVALWIIYLVDSLLLHDALKKRFGLKPRGRFDPLSILISPFLHVNRGHLAANSIPLFVLGSLVMVQGQVVFWLLTLVIVLMAGLGVWLFGAPNTQHMGASSLILGYFGYLLARVFVAPDLATILVAVVVVVLYLGLMWQIVPLKKGVSTAGHLFGFLGGVAGAALLGVLS